MTYDVHLEAEAERDLERFDPPTRKRLYKRLKWLGAHLEELQPEALTGEWAGHFKFRTGDYRVVYQLDRAQGRINVYRIRHRREVYE